jgi:LacI family transcriptional regulator
MGANPTVLIISSPEDGYARNIMRGILQFVREHTDWECIQVRPTASDGAALREYRPFDGVIAEPRTPGEVKHLAKLDVPTVVIHGTPLSTPVAQVVGDNAAVGRLAFAHFETLGFLDYAFAGCPGLWVADARGEAYARIVRASGRKLHADLPALTGQHRHDRLILGRWLRGLPRRTAVFAWNDLMGRDIIIAARTAGIAVPEDIAVLGMDNDELVCELTSPPLSSIDDATSQKGYQAAALLRRLMDGEQEAGSPTIVPPVGVVIRQSTEILAVEQPRIAAALRYIRQFACEGIAIEDVLRHAPGSRRTLEREFRRVLGRTLQKEITRVRMERARQFLRETDLSTIDIAERTAISSASQFSVVFKRETGLTPSRYRRRFRIGKSDDKQTSSQSSGVV